MKNYALILSITKDDVDSLTKIRNSFDSETKAREWLYNTDICDIDAYEDIRIEVFEK